MAFLWLAPPAPVEPHHDGLPAEQVAVEVPGDHVLAGRPGHPLPAGGVQGPQAVGQGQAREGDCALCLRPLLPG